MSTIPQLSHTLNLLKQMQIIQKPSKDYSVSGKPIIECIELNENFNLGGEWCPKWDLNINGLQLAKLKKSIPVMLLPRNLEDKSIWLKKFQLCLKNYNFCDFFEIWGNFLKNQYFANYCLIKVLNWEFFCTHITHLLLIILRTANFVST